MYRHLPQPDSARPGGAASRDVAPGLELDVLTLGEAMVLVSSARTRRPRQVTVVRRYATGAELNVAIGLARLGLRVGYLGRLGADPLGHFLLDAMRAERIDTSLIEIKGPRPTGVRLKTPGRDGQPSTIEDQRGGSAASAMVASDAARLAAVKARHLHITGITPALSAGCRELLFQTVAWARCKGLGISLDPTLDPSLWRSRSEMVATVNELCALCDLVLPSLAEGQCLTGHESPARIAAQLLGSGARQVVVKLGDAGAWCADSAGVACHVPGVQVPRIVDGTGAGDGFAVGVISGLLEGLDLPDAARRGNHIAARVLQYPGENDGLPRRDEMPATRDGSLLA